MTTMRWFHAGVPQMLDRRTFVAARTHHLSQTATIPAEFFGSDRRILPAFPVQRLARNLRSRTQARLTHFPHTLSLRPRIQPHVRRARAPVERVDPPSTLDHRPPPRLTPQLPPPPPPAFPHHHHS